MNADDPIQKYYDELSLREKEILHSMFQSSNSEELTDKYESLKKVIFKAPPPTPEEFLDHKNGWLPQAFADNIYQWVKEDFILMTSGKKHYSQIALYGSTRTGKVN